VKLHRVTSTRDIARPVGEVFALYADFPRHHSPINAAAPAPLGSFVHVPVKVTEVRDNRLIRYRSCNRRCSSARWQARFRRLGPSLTRVEEELVLPLGMLGRWTTAPAVDSQGKH
jgi:hypothetical protein